MFRAVGKQVLDDNFHYADACSERAAKRIADALNGNHGGFDEPDPNQLDLPHVMITGTHQIRQEHDEYACSCGARWDVREGEDHP